MSQVNKVKLNLSAIRDVPIKAYEQDFSFIVNGEEFKTARVIAELLSPKICEKHLNDPTIDTFVINTCSKGNFSKFLELINFTENDISDNELPFICEILQALGNKNIEISDVYKDSEITLDNIFSMITRHEKNAILYRHFYEDEIDFISSNFNDIVEKNEDELMKLNENTLYAIISNGKLRLQSEDQLLRFVNNLYKSDSKFATFYEFVLFSNVSTEAIQEYIDIFDVEYITRAAWSAVTERLKLDIKPLNDKTNENRYQARFFKCSDEKVFSGIINYLREKSNGQIETKIKITGSPIYQNADDHDDPKCTTIFENHEKKSYVSTNELDSWICYEFKEHQVTPTSYTIRARSYHDCCYPRNWVLEGSNGNDQWEMLDEKKDCDVFNKQNIVHTFKINNQQSKKFKIIRIRQTGHNSTNNYHLIINAFEIYGTLNEQYF